MNKEPEIYSILKWTILAVVSIIIFNNPLCQFNLSAEERDPFVSILDLKKKEYAAVKNRIDLSKVILKGIIWNDKQPVAIINDELAMVGDDWHGYKLESIDKDSVVLNDGTKDYKLSVSEDIPDLEKTGPPAQTVTPIENVIAQKDNSPIAPRGNPFGMRRDRPGGINEQ